MYSIVIRGNIESDDVEIAEDSLEPFQDKIVKLISGKLLLQSMPFLARPISTL